jgi:DNA-binding NarL/FixJ family response regulator
MALRDVDARHTDSIRQVATTGHPILIVEDDPEVATTMARLLLGRGYRPTIASTAVEALRLSKRDAFAMALVDVSLGGELDGVEVAEWLSRLYGLPIVFATSSVDEDVLRRASDIEPSAYLVKPIEPPQLHSAVVLAIARSPHGSVPIAATSRDLVYLQRKLDQIRNVVDETRLAARSRVRRPDRLPSGIEELSAREWQIMRDLVETPNAEAIAERRHLSVHTVQNHLKAVFRKLEVHSTAELLTLLLGDR